MYFASDVGRFTTGEFITFDGGYRVPSFPWTNNIQLSYTDGLVRIAPGRQRRPPDAKINSLEAERPVE